jgi:type II secretory pathway pseudopilin PulG
MLVAFAIFGTMLAAAFSVFSSGLQTKRGQDLRLGLQQNLRAAMQVITQDLRSSSVMRLYHQSTCSSGVPCSNNTQIAIFALDGTSTAIASAPGTNITNATDTFVCDASQFQIGDVAVRYNGTQISSNASNNAINFGFNQARVLQITSKTERATPKAACTAGTSQDTLSHSGQSITDTVANDGQSFVFKAALNTYTLRPDPINSSRTALYRLSGLSGPSSALVAYDVSELKVYYGIRSNPTSSSASRVIFYDSLDAVVSALGATTYSAIPEAAGKTYVGGIIAAVRIKLTGRSASNPPGSSTPATFSLTETVDLRN